MPSPLAHTAAGYLIYRYYKRDLPASRIRLLKIPLQFILVAGLSLLPDLDALPGIIMGDMGRFHNNASHSLIVGLFVAIIFSVLVSRISKSPMKPWFAAALISYELHIIMDFFTGERGVMLLWPLTLARFSSPVKLFFGVQWGKGWISGWHLWTIFTEALSFLLILIFLGLLQKYYSKAPADSHTPEKETWS
jgi:membrane-bound metal-dependent hydrolase YbcI (DUF457 family)